MAVALDVVKIGCWKPHIVFVGCAVLCMRVCGGGGELFVKRYCSYCAELIRDFYEFMNLKRDMGRQTERESFRFHD